jgi:AraC-like DNA-binding protein
MEVIKTYPKYLSEHVKFFYSVYATGQEDIGPIHRRLPDGTLDIIFNLGATVSISRDGIKFTDVPQIALTGLHPDRSFMQYKGPVHLVGAVLRPGAAHLFVNDNLNHFESSNLDATLIFGNEIFLISEQLRELSNDKARHDLFERFMFESIMKRKNKNNLQKILCIVDQIDLHCGNIDINKLREDYIMSERTLRRQFTEFVGMSPKQYSTIIRVKSFSKLFEQKRTIYTGLINDLGYTDHAHFNKEFNKVVGMSPTGYFGQLNKIGAEFIHLI